jgi:hypothetical protein
MQKWLYAVSTTFARTFGASFLVLAPGIAQAPNLQAAVSLSVAGLQSAIAAGLRSIQVWIPKFSWAALLPASATAWWRTVAAWADAFTLAFVGAIVAFAAGWLAAPDYSTWKAAWLAGLVGAVTAGLRALEGFLKPGELPAPGTGVGAPPAPPPPPQ